MLRNPEIKSFVYKYIVFTVLAALMAAVFLQPMAVIYTLVICIGAFILFLAWNRQRYQDISKLTLELDKILHANETVSYTPMKEGELAVLANQIAKMTLRLQEQSEQLKRDKVNLNDAIADISHQIRTPLTSVRILMHSLMKEQLTQEERNQYVFDVNSMLSRIEWLITALLQMARLDSGIVVFAKEEIKAAELVKEVLQPFAITLELKEITVNLQIQQDTVFTGDVTWTREALSNIVKNCIEHTPEGGKLTFTITDNTLYTKLIIGDSGKGIADEDLPHLFERFYKGKNSSAQNIGIGLALSRMIIKKENGTIKARNCIQGGVEFEIIFYKGTF